MRSPIPDQDLARIEAGARQSAQWPAQAGSRWVRDVSVDLLDLVTEVHALRAEVTEERRMTQGLHKYAAMLEREITRVSVRLAELGEEAADV